MRGASDASGEPARPRFSWESSPSADDDKVLQRIIESENVTCWTRGELDHPINFFEQAVQCDHCGAQRFRVTPELVCCRRGQLAQLGLDTAAPLELFSLLTHNISKVSQRMLCSSVPHHRSPPSPKFVAPSPQVSRSLNNEFRFSQMSLPIDEYTYSKIGASTHHWDNAHLFITGMPYHTIPNIQAPTNVRAFLEDPAVRLNRVDEVSQKTRPTRQQLSAVEQVREMLCTPSRWGAGGVGGVAFLTLPTMSSHIADDGEVQPVPWRARQLGRVRC